MNNTPTVFAVRDGIPGFENVYESDAQAETALLYYRNLGFFAHIVGQCSRCGEPTNPEWDICGSCMDAEADEPFPRTMRDLM